LGSQAGPIRDETVTFGIRRKKSIFLAAGSFATLVEIGAGAEAVIVATLIPQP
jgi:hypothetical protein